MKVAKATLKTLLGIYDACKGVLSEYDAFDKFYKGGGEKMLSDFEKSLETLGVTFVEPTYTAVRYEKIDPHSRKKTGKFAWGICTDPANPDQTWVLTGLHNEKEANDLITELNRKDGE